MSQDLLVRFKNNKMAVITACLLMATVVIALMAYVIIPDQSNNANRQIPQLALSAPATTHTICYQQANTSDQSWWNAMIAGHQDRNLYYPCDSISITDEQSTIYYQGTEILQSGMFKVQEIRYLLGSDKYGRDVLSRIILGLRVSLFVGFMAVLVSLLIGVTIGSISGYYGGWTDQISMIIINTSWSIPTLLLAFAIIIAMGKGFGVIVLAVGLTMWVDIARLVRGQVKEERQKAYIAGAKVAGLTDGRIIWRHILPNILGPILVLTASNFATAILVEAGLSYLGLGIQPPSPSLGNMLKENYAYATGGYVYLALSPILMIMILVLNFNLLGTALRDVFDIKTT